MATYGFTFKLSHEYLENAPHYQATRDFADGSHQAVVNSRYVMPFKSDLTDEAKSKGVYENRVQRTTNVNVTGTVIDEHLRLCTKSITVTGFEGTKADAILRDVTGYGDTPLMSYKLAARYYLRDGLAGILVENDPEPTQLTRSFQVTYEALNILKLEFFHEGARKGKVREVVLRNADRVDGSNRYMQARRYFFLPGAESFSWEDWEFANDTKLSKQEMKYRILSQGSSDLSQITFQPIGRNSESSLVRAVWPLNQGILNANSLIQNINYHQGCDVTVFLNCDPDGIGSVAEYLAIVVQGNNADVKKLGAGSPDAIVEYRNFLIHWAKRIGMHQMRQLLDDVTKQTQSAESKSKDLAAFEDYCNEVCDYFERWLSNVYRFHAMYENKNTQQSALEKITVAIGREFDLTDSVYELQKDTLLWTWVDALDDTARAALKKQIIKKYTAELKLTPTTETTEDAERVELMKAIDAADVRNPARAPQNATSLRERLLNGRSQTANTNGA